MLYKFFKESLEKIFSHAPSTYLIVWQLLFILLRRKKILLNLFVNSFIAPSSQTFDFRFPSNDPKWRANIGGVALTSQMARLAVFL